MEQQQAEQASPGTVPATSPASTPSGEMTQQELLAWWEKRKSETQNWKSQQATELCPGCNRHLRLEKGLCWACATLKRVDVLDWVACPQCKLEVSKLKDSGICYDCDEAKEKRFFEQKRQEDRFKRIFGSVKAMNYYTFQRFKVTTGNDEAFKRLREFNSEDENVYLFGPCGVGKTHLAYSAAKMYALAGKDVVVSTPLKMVDTFRTKSDLEKEQRFEEYVGCDLLLVDDLGVSKYTDFALEVFCEILNRRTLQMRNGLIVTSNLSLEHLSRRNQEDRLCSRLAGLCDIIELKGDDYRIKS